MHRAVVSRMKLDSILHRTGAAATITRAEGRTSEIMSRTDITVLFATRNGEHVLRRTLEGYCRVEAPVPGWKMVVVDNGSDDATPGILASFKKHLPLETLHQPIVGKNRALNLGLRALEGHFAIVTDDDAIPDESFLRAWSAYLDKLGDYELLGGTIVPLFEVPPPKWLLKSNATLELLFAGRVLPDGPIEAEQIFGPNMAVRSSIFEAGFQFNEDIGPNGSDPHYSMGSETEFCRRVARSGAKAWFAREPRVQHIVRRNQLSKAYFIKRYYQHGRGDAQQRWQSGQPLPHYLSRPPVIEYMWRLYHRVRMHSPFPRQRFDSIFAHHWRRGFRDEWSRRQACDRTNTE
jgi:glycosyltransferase involved in cell wall biosynthesis